MHSSSTLRTCATIALLAGFAACQRDAQPTPSSAPVAEARIAPSPAPVKLATPAPAATPPAATPTPAKQESVAAPRASDSDVRREPDHMLTRLPRATLFVLRFPEIHRAVEFVRSSLAESVLADPRAAADAARRFAGIESEMRRNISDYDVLRADLARVRGDLVIALTRIDPAAFGSRSPSSVPFTLAMMFDAEDEGDALDKLLVRAFREYEEKSARPVTRQSTDDRSWHRHIHFQGTSIDVVREDDFFRLELSAAPSARKADAILPALAREDSFASTVLARSLTPSTAATPAIYQALVHLQPAWDLVRRLAPADAQRVITAGGFDGVQGITMESVAGSDGARDRLTWHSAGARDLMSRVASAGAISPKIAAAVPADHEHALLAAIDVPKLFDGVVALLPRVERELFETSLSPETGSDPRADWIENLGPTFAFSARGNLLQPGEDGVEFLAAIEVRDEARLRKHLDAFVEKEGGGDIRSTDFAGVRIHSVPIGPLPAPDGTPLELEPAFALADGAWLIGSTPAAIRNAIEARTEEDRGNTALRTVAASADDQTWMLSWSRPSTGPANLATARKTPDGLVFDASHGSVTAGIGALSVLSIVSSVAIPKLMAARLTANEANAIDTLRDIARAQALLHANTTFDRDGDRKGEYALLEELCHAEPRDHGAAETDPPMLSPSSFQELVAGVGMRGGYLFRVDLRAGAKNSVSDLVAAPRIDTDAAEGRFVAYAWPLHASSTGQRVFAVDSSGVVYATQNNAAEQAYSGRARPPQPSAWCLDATDVRNQFKPDVHLGGDGASWRRVD